MYIYRTYNICPPYNEIHLGNISCIILCLDSLANLIPCLAIVFSKIFLTNRLLFNSLNY